MSRLKERKRRNIIKAISCCLTLALSIGLAQCLGTYALFTDTEDVASELAISTGDVDVEINEKKLNYTDVQPSSELKHKFKISNYGTLNQNISLDLVAPTEDISNKIYNYIDSYKIEFGVLLEQIQPVNRLQEVGQNVVTIENLKGLKQGLKTHDGKLFILKPGQTITCNVTIKMKPMTQEEQAKLSGKALDMKLKVEATQLSEKSILGKGFYDIEVQSNMLTIGEANIISWGNGMKYAGNGSTNDFIEIAFNKVYPDVKEKNRIKIIETKGQFRKDIAIVERDNGNTFTIKLNQATNPGKFSTEFNGTDVIVLQFNYENGKYIKVHFDFRQNPNALGNQKVEAKYTILDTGKVESNQDIIIPFDQEIVEPPKEETEVQSEPEIADPPKEEIEEPIESEIVEPPKEEVEVPSEPEVTEPPKQEIIEIAKQPELTEPSTEIQEIQE
ncbi:MAG: TasA family protein [Peptostreptococcaceae bacterium]